MCFDKSTPPKRGSTVVLVGVLLVACSLRLSLADEPKPPCEVYRSITYIERGKRALKLDAFVPHGKGPFPAVLLVHGGGWTFGTRWQVGHHGVTLAKRGYATFSVSYRLAPRHPFPAQIDDCRSALIWVRKSAKKYKVDKKRIGGAGYSAGAHLVCLLAATGRPPQASNGNIDTRLQAVVAGGAPCDFRQHPENSRSLAYWLGGTRKQKPGVYRDASPAAFVTKTTPPIFFYNGTEDKIVPMSWTQPMYRELKKAKVATEMYQVKGAGHLGAFLNPTCIAKACEFLDKHLKPSSSQP